MRSGEQEKGLRFLIRCAQHTTQIGQPAQALSILERAKTMARRQEDIIDIIGEMILAATASSNWNAVHELSKEYEHESAGLATALHSDREMAELLALWNLNSAAGELVPRLQRCLDSQDCTMQHRLDAAQIGLIVAHEKCDAVLAANIHHALEAHIPSESADWLQLSSFYQAVFGKRNVALASGRSAWMRLAEIESLPRRMRTARNLMATFNMIGAYADAIELGERCYDQAVALRVTLWQHDFALAICAACVSREDFESGEFWHKRAMLHEPTAHRGILSLMHCANGIELSLARGDAAQAETLFRAGFSNLGEQWRLVSYARGLELRIRQVDPAYRSDDATLDACLSLFHRTKRFACADSLMQAIGEELVRRGRLSELKSVLDEYVATARRELPPLPPALTRLRDLCQAVRC